MKIVIISTRVYFIVTCLRLLTVWFVVAGDTWSPECHAHMESLLAEGGTCVFLAKHGDSYLVEMAYNGEQSLREALISANFAQLVSTGSHRSDRSHGSHRSDSSSGHSRASSTRAPHKQPAAAVTAEVVSRPSRPSQGATIAACSMANLGQYMFTALGETSQTVH